MTDTPALVIGLTGGIGAGKSTVARHLADQGADIVDVDALGRAVLEPGGAAHEPVIAAFGTGIVGSDGRIDRRRLGGIVFADPVSLARLEAISHPAIDTALAAAIAAATSPVVVVDMAVLAESRLGRDESGRPRWHRVVVVETPLEQRLPRLVARGMSLPEAEARIASQASDPQRRALADLVVPNDGSEAELVDFLDRCRPTIDAWRLQVATGSRAGHLVGERPA